jgi:hypothetical protein
MIQIPTLAAFFCLACFFLSPAHAAVSAPKAASSGTVDPRPLPENEIFWEDSGHRSAFFISERLLNEWPWDALAMDPARRKEMEARVSAPLRGTEFYYPNRPSRECVTDLHTGIGEPHRQAVGFVEFVRQKPVALMGRVLSVIPGWNIPYSYASSMVEVRVEEIFKTQKGWPQVGNRFFYEQKRGTVTVQGHRLCTEAQRGQETYRAAVGDLIFLAGPGRYIDYPEDARLAAGAIWPVSGNEIEPQPYSMIEEPRRALSAPRLHLLLQQSPDDHP